VPAVLGVLLAVVVVGVAVTVAVYPKSHHPGAAAGNQTHTSTPAHHVTTKTQATTVTSTTSTTVPQTVQPEGATATAQAATYDAPDVPYTVTLTSTGPCWVYASLVSTNTVLWTGVLNSGQTQTLNANGQLVVRLGHANSLTASLNGVPVDYPAQFSAVFTMSFVPPTT
jgi:Domain of unknown function (DUF4115)